jgi:hypothetical protein
MKLRSFIAALLTFWLVVGPVGTVWAANAPVPCDSMGMNQPLPTADDCCGDEMDASACLSACMAAAAVALPSSSRIIRLDPGASAVPGLSLRYATLLAPPDIAPPKAFVS